jgi:predicted DsbA family dithiol-disulfide isomerase
MSEPYDDERTVLHWYDFACPFSYVGQHRTALLVEAGFDVVLLPFQAHPGIPPGGVPMRFGHGPRHAMIERQARAVGMPLRWPRRIPHSRRALAAAEWARLNQPDAFAELHRWLFDAHFAFGEDIDDQAVVDRYALLAGVDVGRLHAALSDGSAAASVAQAEWVARHRGVDGTPAWLVDGRLMVGLQPARDFARLGELTARVRR